MKLRSETVAVLRVLAEIEGWKLSADLAEILERPQDITKQILIRGRERGLIERRKYRPPITGTYTGKNRAYLYRISDLGRDALADYDCARVGVPRMRTTVRPNAMVNSVFALGAAV